MYRNYTLYTSTGTAVLHRISSIQAVDHELPLVVITAWATVDLAVESMRLGVRDFVQKPWENSRLLKKLRTQIDAGRARRLQQHREAETRLELDEAREIQQGLMPRRMPNLPGFSLASAWQPAHEVSGDYLGAFKLSDTHAALCVADVA